jgi:4-hydroxy-tetrahydrodipicolinate synthase
MITAMVTPFDDNLELDLPRAQELALKLIDEGSDALVVCGTTGESPTVFYPQKLDLFSAVIEAVDGRVPIIANAGDNCTHDSVEFAQKVEKLGVDGIMAVVPYYKPPQEGLSALLRNQQRVDLVISQHPGRCVIDADPLRS